MRVIRLLVLVVAVVIAAFVVLVAVLPGLTDWNRYRGTLELLAGEALGRPVSIAGPVSLSVLPEPVLTASQVSVGGGGGGRITVRELRLGVALLPLLTGEIDARSLTLQRPEFHLPWPPWRGMALAAPPWPATLSARIEDGRIETGGLELKNVDATLVAGQGDAALTLVGSATDGRSTWNLSLRLGEPGPDENAPLEATLQGGGDAQGAAAKVTGRLSPEGDFAGHLALDGPKLSQLIAAPALPFHVDSSFTVDHDAVRLAGLSVTLGSVAAHGAGRLTLQPAGRLDLVLVSAQAIPLDPWLKVMRGGGGSRMPIGLSVSAPRATLAHGLLQNLSLAMVFGPKGAEIGAFRAILPGDATFAAEGQMARAADAAAGWQFEGTAHLAAASLLGLVHWLDEAAPGVLPPLPASVLGKLAIGGRVVIGTNAIALDDLVGSIDQSKVAGSLSLGLGGHPAISAGLTLDRLDLDPWLPSTVRQIPPHRFPLLAKLPALFKGMSVELRLAAQTAILGRTRISGLSLDAAAEPGQVILRRFDATIDGVHTIASGTIGKAGGVTAGRLALTGTGLGALATELPLPLQRAIGRWQTGFSLNATAAGPPHALKLAITADLGDLTLTASPVINFTNATWQGPVSLHHPGAAKLVTGLGFANPLDWLGPGSFSLIGLAAGGAQGWSLQQFRLIAGALHAAGNLKQPPGAEIIGNVHARLLPVPTPGAAAVGLLAGLIGPQQATIGLTADRVMADRRVLLQRVHGRLTVSGTAVTLDFNANTEGAGAMAAVLRLAAGQGPPRFRLGIAFSGVALKGGLSAGVPDLGSGTLDGQAALTAEGYDPATLAATLAGSVELTVRDGMLFGVSLGQLRTALAGTEKDTEAAAALGKALQGGRSRFARLRLAAHVSSGRFQLQRAEMVGQDGVIKAQGTLDLPARSEALLLTIRPALAGAPVMLLRLGGPIANPRRVEEIGAALQWHARKQARP